MLKVLGSLIMSIIALILVIVGTPFAFVGFSVSFGWQFAALGFRLAERSMNNTDKYKPI